jgi:hypothetical protein
MLNKYRKQAIKASTIPRVVYILISSWIHTDLKKLHSDAVSLHAVISQAKDDKQQDIKRTSNFIDYYSYESRNTSSSNISSLNSSVKELIKLENERFELENQLHNKTKQVNKHEIPRQTTNNNILVFIFRCQTEICACDIIASIDKAIHK